MEKLVDEFSLGLFIWQLVILSIIIATIYFVVKFGKVFYKFLKHKY